MSPTKGVNYLFQIRREKYYHLGIKINHEGELRTLTNQPITTYEIHLIREKQRQLDEEEDAKRRYHKTTTSATMTSSSSRKIKGKYPGLGTKHRLFLFV